MFPAERQVEEHSHAIGIVIHECGHVLKDENLPRRVSRGDASPKTLERDESATLMKSEANMIVSENETTCGTNIQPITTILE